MKIKKIMPLFTLLAIVALTVTPVLANGDHYESELIAGKNHEVGCVKLYFDSADWAHNKLYIKVDTTVHANDIEIQNPCEIVETHIWVGTDLNDVPRTKSGNPKIGKFDYSQEFSDGTTQFIAEFDTSAYASGTTVYVLVHAVVDCPCGEETAWADSFGTPFSERPDIFGKRWGYFLEFTI